MRKYRNVSSPQGGLRRATSSSAWTPYTVPGTSINEAMDTFSHDLSKLGRGDCGGPWLHTKDSRSHTAFFLSPGMNPGLTTLIDGPIVISQAIESYTSLQGGNFSKPTDTQLDAAGTKAIARTEPTNPAFSAATFLGELREGVPTVSGTSVWREKTLNARSAGSEYLNVQFGWLPLISDMKKFFRAVDESDRILNQYHKGSDTSIRRGFVFPSETNTRTFTGSLGALPTGSFQGTAVKSNTFRQWFKGSFRYHLPSGESNSSKISKWASDVRKLYGVELTPEIIWNLAPWSWAADWFGSVGDVMHNVSALGRDGLVLQYGYVMAEVATRYSASGRYTTGSYPVTGSASYSSENLIQVRKPATPYGFGVNLSGLSAKQVSILVALGLSRS